MAAASNGMDDLAIAQKQLYDQYGLCAGQLIDVIRCAQGGDCGSGTTSNSDSETRTKK